MIEAYLNLLDNLVLLSNVVDEKIDIPDEVIEDNLAAFDAEKNIKDSGLASALVLLIGDVLGTTNQIIVTDNEDGTVTLSTPQNIDTDADVEFDSATLDDLTASRMLSADENKKIVSIADLTAWIGGTANRVTVTDHGDGTVTLSTPQDIHSGASPTFVDLLLSGSKIDTQSVTPTDLEIDCGVNKTLELTETVWEDLQFSVSGAKVPAANAPTWEALTANHKAYSFDVNDYKDQEENELPHWWKEGTDGKVHIHTATKTANATGNDRFAKYTVYIAYENASNIWVEVSLTAELTIPDGTSAKQGFKLSMGTITLTGLNLGTQIGCRIERIAATGGTEYADNMFITQVGIHLEVDTMGSRQEYLK